MSHTDCNLRNRNSSYQQRWHQTGKFFVSFPFAIYSCFEQSVIAEEADVRTSSGDIDGRYVSSGDLTLKTKNGHIRAAVEFGQAERLSVLDVTTTNKYGPFFAPDRPLVLIHVYDSFIETDITAHGTNSTVTIFTSNGHLVTNVLDMPVDAVLNLDARTSNNKANLSVPPSFEGTFHLSTFSSQSRLNEYNQVEDPKGEGRKRSAITRTTGKGIRAGNIYWDEKAMNRGSVKLSTSNGVATLKL